jgi:hypothetical protein
MVGWQELPILERSDVRNDIQARAGRFSALTLQFTVSAVQVNFLPSC